MLGTYCIFDLEPNKEFSLGVLKMSWLICKFMGDNNMVTLTTTEYYISPENPKKFKNYDYKTHGISNNTLKLEGESLFYVLDQFREDLKTFKVNYICGFKIKEKDLPYIYKIANKHNITTMKQEYMEKKFIILDVMQIAGKWTKLNNRSCKLTFEELYPRLFKANFPKTKYHNTTTDCQHSRNILFKLLMDDPSIFDDIKPLIDESIEFKQIDELKHMVDEQLLNENNQLKASSIKLEICILELQLKLENSEEKSQKQNIEIKMWQDKYSEVRDKTIEYETKLQCLENEIYKRDEKFKIIFDKSEKELQLEQQLEETQQALLDIKTNSDKNDELTQMIIGRLEDKVLEYGKLEEELENNKHQTTKLKQLSEELDTLNVKNENLQKQVGQCFQENEKLKKELVEKDDHFKRHQEVSQKIISSLKKQKRTMIIE